MKTPRHQDEKKEKLLALLLSELYRDSLAPEHLEDLRKSGLTNETIHAHFVRSVPPWMIPGLLGFDPPHVESALLFPFLSPNGGFMHHIRIKVFGPQASGETKWPKYFQPKGAAPRLYFTLPALKELAGEIPIWLVEGEKKALAVAQFGLPAVGFSGIHGWHLHRTRDLLTDFDFIQLRGRLVELVPDGDWKTNQHVEKGAMGLSLGLRACGAQVRWVDLPSEIAAYGKSRN